MAIPGIDTVAAEDEDFSFNAGSEANEATRKSKYVFANGTYNAKCVGVEKSNSKAGSPMYVFTFLGISGPANGIEFRLWCVLSEKAAFKLAQVYRGFGLVADATGNFDVKKSSLVGKTVGLALEQAILSNGKLTMAVSEVKAATQATDSDIIPF